MTLVQILMAFGLSVAGGIAGAMILGAARGAPVDHSVDWGTLIGGVAAALAALYVAQRALDEYFRQQERDEVSRRFVDEGIDRLGRHIADAYAVLSGNLWIVSEAEVFARLGLPEGVVERLAAIKPVDAAGLSYEGARLVAQLSDETVARLLRQAVLDIENIARQVSQVLPFQLRNAHLLNEAARASVTETVRVSVAVFLVQIRTVQRPLVDGLARLSLAFQAAQIGQVEESIRWDRVERLAPALVAFRQTAAEALRQRAERENTQEFRTRMLDDLTRLGGQWPTDG